MAVVPVIVEGETPGRSEGLRVPLLYRIRKVWGRPAACRRCKDGCRARTPLEQQKSLRNRDHVQQAES
jgi:hypothetical protein